MLISSTLRIVAAAAVFPTMAFAVDLGEKPIDKKAPGDSASVIADPPGTYVDGKCDSSTYIVWGGGGPTFTGTATYPGAGSHAGKFSGHYIPPGSGGSGTPPILDWTMTTKEKVVKPEITNTALTLNQGEALDMAAAMTPADEQAFLKWAITSGVCLIGEATGHVTFKPETAEAPITELTALVKAYHSQLTNAKDEKTLTLVPFKRVGVPAATSTPAGPTVTCNSSNNTPGEPDAKQGVFHFKYQSSDDKCTGRYAYKIPVKCTGYVSGSVNSGVTRIGTAKAWAAVTAQFDGGALQQIVREVGVGTSSETSPVGVSVGVISLTPTYQKSGSDSKDVGENRTFATANGVYIDHPATIAILRDHTADMGASALTEVSLGGTALARATLTIAVDSSSTTALVEFKPRIPAP